MKSFKLYLVVSIIVLAVVSYFTIVPWYRQQFYQGEYQLVTKTTRGFSKPTMTLTLHHHGIAVLSSEILGKQASILEAGHWNLNRDDHLVVTLTHRNGYTRKNPDVMVFAKSNDKFEAISFNHTVHRQRSLWLIRKK